MRLDDELRSLDIRQHLQTLGGVGMRVTQAKPLYPMLVTQWVVSCNA